MVHPVAHWASICGSMPSTVHRAFEQLPAQFGGLRADHWRFDTLGTRISTEMRLSTSVTAPSTLGISSTRQTRVHRNSSRVYRRPIFKDRTFFFADYRRLAPIQGSTQVDTVPFTGSTGWTSLRPSDCVRQVQWQWTLRLRGFLKAFYHCRMGLCCAHFLHVLQEQDTGIFTSQDRRSRLRIIYNQD